MAQFVFLIMFLIILLFQVKKKIFIVHGHDNEVKLEVARFIEKIGLEPIILHEQVNSGMTVIEKIENTQM